MTAVYKIKFTRPSLDDNFLFDFLNYPESEEPATLPTPIAELPGLDVTASTLPSNLDVFYPTYEEKILTRDIYSRLSELRADLKDHVLSNWNDGDNDWLIQTEWSPWNPFSLTHTLVFTFDTFANLVTSYNMNSTDDVTNGFVNAAKRVNNTISEEFYDNGVLQTSLVSKFAGRF